MDRFTDREMDVLRLIAAGHANQEIADRLFITTITVKNYISEIYSKLRMDAGYDPGRAALRVRAATMFLDELGKDHDLDVDFKLRFNPVNEDRGQVKARAMEVAERRIDEEIDRTRFYGREDDDVDPGPDAE